MVIWRDQDAEDEPRNKNNLLQEAIEPYRGTADQLIILRTRSRSTEVAENAILLWTAISLQTLHELRRQCQDDCRTGRLCMIILPLNMGRREVGIKLLRLSLPHIGVRDKEDPARSSTSAYRRPLGQLNLLWLVWSPTS